MNSHAEGNALMNLSREWSERVATLPVNDWIDFWADDAVMLPPGLPPIRGKAAIREYVETTASIPGFQIRWQPESVCVSQSGDFAYMIERNVTTVSDAHGNPVTTHGKVVTVWRKGPDGVWRNVVDIWNAAPPPAK